MNYDQASIFKTYEILNGSIAAVCMGGLLRNHVRIYRHPSGLYRSMDENIERYSERFGIPCGEIRGVIDGRSCPSEPLLHHLRLRRHSHDSGGECAICGDIHDRFSYYSL